MSKNKIPDFKDFEEVIKYIIDNFGKESLLNEEKTLNIIDDLTRKFEKEKKFLKDVYYCKNMQLLIQNDKNGEQQKNAAYRNAKTKLVDKAGLSENNAEDILKSIVGALGWKNVCDTRSETPSKEEIKKTSGSLQDIANISESKSAVERSNSVPSTSTLDVTAPKSVKEEQIQQDEKSKDSRNKRKKFNPLPLIIIAAIAFFIGKNYINNQEESKMVTKAAVSDITVVASEDSVHSDTSTQEIITEQVTTLPVTQMEVITTEPQVQTDIQTESVISDEGITISETGVADTSDNSDVSDANNYLIPSVNVETTETTTTQSEESYNICDITTINLCKEFESGCDMDLCTAYDNKTNVFYYLHEDMFKCFDMNTKENIELMNYDDIRVIINEYMVTQGYNECANISIQGITRNQFDENLYLYGCCKYSSEKYYGWIMNLSNNEIRLGSYNFDYGMISFFDTNKFLILPFNSFYYDAVDLDADSIIKINTGRYMIVNSYFYNDYYYFYEKDDVNSSWSINNVGNVYSPTFGGKAILYEDYNGQDDMKHYVGGNDFFNGNFYFKDAQNTIWMYNPDNEKYEVFISIDNIKQTGKNFLSNSQCYNLKMCNNGFVTYDSADMKLKYIYKN